MKLIVIKLNDYHSKCNIKKNNKNNAQKLWNLKFLKKENFLLSKNLKSENEIFKIII